jgi:hypothetical protein
VGQDRQELVLAAVGLLRRQKPRILDSDDGTVGEVFCSGQIGQIVYPTRFRRDERERAERSRSGTERCTNKGLQAQLPDHPQMVLVPGRFHQQGVRDHRQPLRLARLQHLHDAVGVGRLWGITAEELMGQL